MQERVARQETAVHELEDALTAAQQRAAEATRKLNAEARRADAAERGSRRRPAARPAARARPRSAPPRRSSGSPSWSRRSTCVRAELDVVTAGLARRRGRSVPPTPDRAPLSPARWGRIADRDPRGQPVRERPRRGPGRRARAAARLDGRHPRPGRPVRRRPADPPAARPRAARPRLGRAPRVDDVLVEVSEHGLLMRENVVVRDAEGDIHAWGSVHDRSVGRMLFVHVVQRDLPDERRRRLLGAAVRVGRGAGARGRRGPRPGDPADRHRRLRGRRASGTAGCPAPASRGSGPGGR